MDGAPASMHKGKPRFPAFSLGKSSATGRLRMGFETFSEMPEATEVAPLCR